MIPTHPFCVFIVMPVTSPIFGVVAAHRLLITCSNPNLNTSVVLWFITFYFKKKVSCSLKIDEKNLQSSLICKCYILLHMESYAMVSHRVSRLLVEWCVCLHATSWFFLVIFFITQRSCFDNTLYFHITLKPNGVIVLWSAFI